MKSSELPAVCIVGRPNVGKSTLFNRIIGKRKAVVHDIGGTTRDRIEAIYEKDEMAFRLVDTGGFLKTDPDEISSLVKKQIKEAIGEAEILLFVCEIKPGITPQDEELLPILRESNKRVFLVVNKVDNERMEGGIYDFYEFGLGNPYPVSAVHNQGIGRLINDLLQALDLKKMGQRESVAYKIAITGRPNVGKSLFLNTLLKKERVIVNKTPGTTRDSIDTYFRKDDDLLLLIDTAGIRHKRKVKEAMDIYSMLRSKEAIKRSDVSFLLIDGYEGLRNDDIGIFNFITKCGKCCILVVNKWDLVKRIPMANYKNALIRKTPTIASYPIVFASAKTGRNVLSCVDMAKYLVKNSGLVIKTKELNEILLQTKYIPMRRREKRPKFYYMVQTSTGPPSFLIFVNNPRFIREDYTNFIEGALRKGFNLFGTPIKINYRRKR